MKKNVCQSLLFFLLYRVCLQETSSFVSFQSHSVILLMYVTWVFFSTERYTIWIFEYAYRCAEKIQTDSGYVGTKVNKPMELCLYRWCFQRFNRMLNLNTDIILIRLDLHFNRIFFNVRIKIHSHVNRINSMLEPNFGHELDLF